VTYQRAGECLDAWFMEKNRKDSGQEVAERGGQPSLRHAQDRL